MPSQAIDWTALLQQLQSLAGKIPQAVLIVEQLIALFQTKQAMMAPACPDADCLCECIDQAIQGNLTSLVHLTHLKACCQKGE